jgi:hypothetical protein
MPNRSETKAAFERLEDAMREIGTLLVAFAPMDAVLAEPGRRGLVLIFCLVGVLLFMGSLWLERRDRHVA